jgi:DNA polymerase-4
VIYWTNVQYIMTAAAPRICCLDLDTFFVSVERLLDPSLVGKPVVVGGRKGGGGVVTAASYEVRVYGVRSGMSIAEATSLAPQAVFLSGTHGVYSEYSTKARAIIERYSPDVRAASIDEAYIDFRGCERLYHKPEDRSDDHTIRRTVCELTGAIRNELGLPASAGIATSKSMAKVASALAKPEGVLLVEAGAEAETLAPLGVRKLPGVGPVTEGKLVRVGIVTLGDLAAAPDDLLHRVFGVYASSIRRSARGIGNTEIGRERPAFREYDPKGGRIGSISNERTFSEKSARVSDSVLSSLCERVCWRARTRGVKARTVTLKLRYTDFHTITRAHTMAATHCDVKLYRVVRKLYRQARTRDLPIRLLGVALSKLVLHAEQLELFDADNERRCNAIDSVRAKYGYDAMHVATTMKPKGSREPSRGG